MLRSFFVFLSKAVWARRVVMDWPVAWRLASRFVAGDKLEDAIRVVQNLNDRGINATLDHLGEQTTNHEEAVQAVEDILKALNAIQEAGVRANVSIKLTQIGLVLDQQLCVQNLRRILEHARGLGNFIRVDMEDGKVTQPTLDILYQMRQEGYENVGAVLQAYLYRSELDARHLVRECIKVRLCKGAYKEPASIAYPRKKDVDLAFDRLTGILIQGALEQDCPLISSDGRHPPLVALATHDEQRILIAKERANQVNLPVQALEFQMLYGIRRDLQESLSSEGYPVRIYVPYGSEWYPYLMRRLGERPANVWFIVSNFFRR